MQVINKSWVISMIYKSNFCSILSFAFLKGVLTHFDLIFLSNPPIPI